MSQWINNSVFYHIYPLGFCGCPEFNDGKTEYRLDKLGEWIPHLKRMGVNALYLGPVFESLKHGYDTSDYYRIDCRLGDNESFKKLCDELHANGIKIILDGVFNHVGRDFWAFKDVQKYGSNSQYCGWFQNLTFNGRSPYDDPFWYEGWSGHYDLVKLNLYNQAVVDHLIGAVSMWMDEFKIDGLRLDAADCIEPNFFRALRRFCKSKDPDFWLMGEIIHGDYNRWANPEMMDSVTNYECYKGIYSSHNDKNYFEIAHSLQRQFANGGIYQNLCLYNFLDNHDVNRIGSTLRNPAHLKNAYTVLFTMPGVPSIYYGSEWAIEGTRTRESDQMLRPCLELDTPLAKTHSLVPHISALSALRKSFPALCSGKYENVMIRNEQLVYKRYTGDQTVLVALNITDNEYWLDFPISGGSVLTDVLVDGSEYRVENNHANVMIPANGARVLLLHNGDFNYHDFKEKSDSDLQSGIIADSYTEEQKAVAEAQAQQGETQVPSAHNDEANPAKRQAKLGKYRSWDGSLFAVIALATNTDDHEPAIIYKELFNNGLIFTCSAKGFLEDIEVDGRMVPKFEYVDSDE